MEMTRKTRDRFIHIFLEKNKQLNLSSLRDEEGVFLKHVKDTLECLNLEKQLGTPIFSPGLSVVDVGTGGGIPLLPLAILYPEVQFLGIDSVRKKTIAVQEMADELELKNVKTLWTRTEEYTGKQFDILTARAVAYADVLFKNTFHLVKPGGYFVLYKMFSEEEEAWIDSYVQQRGMKMIRKHYYKLFEDDIQRVIYVIQKGVPFVKK